MTNTISSIKNSSSSSSTGYKSTSNNNSKKSSLSNWMNFKKVKSESTFKGIDTGNISQDGKTASSGG